MVTIDNRALEFKGSPGYIIVEDGAADKEDVAGGAVGLSFLLDGCSKAIDVDVDTKIQLSTETQGPFVSIKQASKILR